MCGIAGIIARHRITPNQRRVVESMCAALEHRGPDEIGLMQDDVASFGVRRLAVIDLQLGQLPIRNENETVFAFLNGEIYNYRELRDQLKRQGHRFRTQGDAEVIVHLYEEYGDAFVDHLDGMFAIALWDHLKNRLLLVRDRLGVKPLYYQADHEALRFGSEIKAILQDPAVRREPNYSAIDEMLTLGTSTAPATVFEGVWQVPPASVLTYEDGRLTTRVYWQLDRTTRIAAGDRLVQEAADRIRTAAMRRMVSDVPVGVFLSGGLDSATLVALLSRESNSPLRTFSIGFDEADYSELAAARQVAKLFGTHHSEHIVKPDIESCLEPLIQHHDGPFFDSSAFPMYHLARIAREQVTVALSGDGGDELFAGYGIFAADKAAEWFRQFPYPLRKLTEWGARFLNSAGDEYRNRGRVLQEFVRVAEQEPLVRYAHWAAKMKRDTREQLYCDSKMKAALLASDTSRLQAFYDEGNGITRLSRLLNVATRGELAGDMLVKVDRMSMAHSLEVRSPFLDHHLVQWAASLPDSVKLRGLRSSKVLLRKVAADLLPKAFLNRPKRGFSIPLSRWLRTTWNSKLREILCDSRTIDRHLFHQPVIEKMIDDHTQARRNCARELWTLMTLEVWMRMYIDDFGRSVPDLPSPQTHISSFEPTRASL